MLHMPERQSVNIPPAILRVRCVAERRGDQWQAFSLEFGLAAQADSYADAKRKLEAMIVSYVYDALVGEDRDHAGELLTRRASISVYGKYYWRSLFEHFSGGDGNNKDNSGIYSSALPVTPIGCAA